MGESSDEVEGLFVVCLERISDFMGMVCFLNISVNFAPFDNWYHIQFNS